ncbi:MAG: hypothetical protein AAGC43_00020 [Bacteroidota bacterium]
MCRLRSKSRYEDGGSGRPKNPITYMVLKELDSKELYKNTELTLDLLSYNIGCPKYKIVKALKVDWGLTFKEFVNQFRILKMTSIMTQEIDQEALEELAYNSGFSTPSSFYNALEKHNS